MGVSLCQLIRTPDEGALEELWAEPACASVGGPFENVRTSTRKTLAITETVLRFVIVGRKATRFPRLSATDIVVPWHERAGL
jgi:hypothetical protein